MQLVVSGQCVMRMPANLNLEDGSIVPFSTSLAWVAMITWGGLIPDQAAGARVRPGASLYFLVKLIVDLS